MLSSSHSRIQGDKGSILMSVSPTQVGRDTVNCMQALSGSLVDLPSFH